MESVDQDRVSANIDDIHDDGYLHGHLGIAHGTEDRRASIIQGHEWDRCRHDHQVGIGMPHYVGLDLSEDPVQDEVFSRIDQQGNHNRAQGNEPYQLGGRLTGFLLILLSQILSGHHRAAGCKGGKYIDQQDHDLIYQRYAGDGCLAHARNHNRIRHANKYCKKLLDDQRNN